MAISSPLLLYVNSPLNSLGVLLKFFKLYIPTHIVFTVGFIVILLALSALIFESLLLVIFVSIFVILVSDISLEFVVLLSTLLVIFSSNKEFTS
jgi:hypothetical protein